MNDTDSVLPPSDEVKRENALRAARVYGEGWETGHGKTFQEESRDTTIMFGIIMLLAVCTLVIGGLFLVLLL